MAISNGVNGALGRGLGSLIPMGSVGKHGSEQPMDQRNIVLVPPAQIVLNPHQPRKGTDHAALEDLVNSIREHGILQPLVVMRQGTTYQLIAGERRLKAAQILGLKAVPVVVRDASTQEQLELAIVENVQRKDLNPMERAYAYHALIDEFHLTQEQVAKRVGKARVTIANTLRLLELPAEVQQAIADGKISEGHAKVIASAPTASDQLKLFREILERSLTVRAGAVAAQKIPSRRLKKPGDPELIAAEEELRERFGTRVRIDKRRKTGTITIEFYSDEEFRTLLERLRRS